MVINYTMATTDSHATIRSQRCAEFWSCEKRNDHFTFDEYLDFLDHGEWDRLEAYRDDRILWDYYGCNSPGFNDPSDWDHLSHPDHHPNHRDDYHVYTGKISNRPLQSFQKSAATFGDDDFPDDPVNEEPWRLPKKCGN